MERPFSAVDLLRPRTRDGPRQYKGSAWPPAPADRALAGEDAVGGFQVIADAVADGGQELQAA